MKEKHPDPMRFAQPDTSWEALASDEKGALERTQAQLLEQFFPAEPQSAKLPQKAMHAHVPPLPREAGEEGVALSPRAGRVSAKASRPQETPRTRAKRAVVWGLGGVTMLLLCVVGLWWGRGPDAPAFAVVGGPVMVKENAARRPTFRLRTREGQHAQLSVEGLWSMRLQASTSLRVTSRGKRVLGTFLQRGKIDVHVTPGAMQEFSVNTPMGWEVLVKGTRFSVAQGSGWLRVEVTRGVVSCRLKDAKSPTRLQKQPSPGSVSGKAIRLGAGEGVRLWGGHAQPVVLRYRLPAAKKGLGRRMQGWAQHAPLQLYWFARDLRILARWQRVSPVRKRSPQPRRASAGQLPGLPAQQRAMIEKAAHFLFGRKHHRLAFRLWKHLATLHKDPDNIETAWASAVQSCHQGHLADKACLSAFQRYLRSYPRGASHQHVQFWFADWLWHHRAAAPGGSALLQAQHQRVLRRYPRGFYATIVRSRLRMIRQHTPNRWQHREKSAPGSKLPRRSPAKREVP